MQVDVHQHLWPTQLIDALRRRTRPPRLRGWTLQLHGQPDDPLDPTAHDLAARTEQAVRDGLDLALVCLSSPLGIEFLPPGEADELLDAYHDGVLALPPPFQGWAAARLTQPDGAELARQLERGFVGLQLPATALLDERGYRTAAPLLEVLEDAQRPLMIHPGVAGPSPHASPWWPAMVDYVQQMHAAWFAFREYGRPTYPGLRVCFAMLAGLAPIHGERFASRTGLRSVLDERSFLEISSYGTRAIDATIRVLGIDVLVNGSDRPYSEPKLPELGPAAVAAIRSSNPARLLDRKEVMHGMAVASAAQS
jgi:6-methylsalicylate decarboxylase